ncbi:MAG: tetratricopeptide repeat protein [Acidobacteria bacterium]|nr:tetratricopeptide repeat protein [Acidobacteriota bacterium]
MRVVFLIFSLLLSFSITKGQVTSTNNATSLAETKSLAMPDLMLDVQVEFARIGDLRADERVKELPVFIKKWSNTPLAFAAQESLLRARAALAETYLKQQRIETALTEFQIAINEFPKPLSDRTFSTMLAFALTIFNHGFRKEALEFIKQFESSAGEQPNRLAQIATFYLSAENGQEAQRILAKVVELEPKTSKYYYALGNAYLIQLKLKEAKAAFQQTINLEPKHPLAFASLATLYRAEKSLEDAIALYKRQLEVTPESEVAHAGLAISYLLTKQDDLATEELAKQFAISPRDFHLFTQLGYLSATRNDYKKARSWAELALSIAPTYAWARIVLANSLVAQGEFSSAEEVLSDIVVRGTNFPTLQLEITHSLLLAENFDGAFEQTEQFLKITPEGNFEAQVGGQLVNSRSLKSLLEKERQAAIALPDSLISDEHYKLIEGFLKFQFYLSKLKEKPLQNNETEVLGRRQRAEIQVRALEALTYFLGVKDERIAFRKMWVAQELFQTDIALERAVEISTELVKEAENATRAEGSIREAPDLDFSKRQALFRARAYHLLGQIRFKQGQLEEATKILKMAVDNFSVGPEQRIAISHLATVTQTSGNDKEALSLYIKSYNKYDENATVQKSMIENLYRKVHGSLEGLELK